MEVRLAGKNFVASIVLNNWNLQIESWTKGNNPADMKKEIINVGKLEKLLAWNQINNLQNVSGIGTYTTTFNLGGESRRGTATSRRERYF